jgi:ribosome-associated heat shock protein Hsp15
MIAPALRLDKWLWHARFYRSRSLAAKLCETGPMRINGAAVTKAHYLVREGDTLTFVWSGRVRVVRILALSTRRGPASEARTLYVDLDASGEPIGASPPATGTASPVEIPSGS